MPIINIFNLIVRFFLMITPEDTQQIRLKTVKSLDSYSDDLKSYPALK